MDSNLQSVDSKLQSGGNGLCFLDLKLSLHDNKIPTTVYNKLTNDRLYLLEDSCHHLSSVLGWQNGVALRLCKICSTDKEHSNKSKEYKAYLIGGGHIL